MKEQTSIFTFYIRRRAKESVEELHARTPPRYEQPTAQPSAGEAR